MGNKTNFCRSSHIFRSVSELHYIYSTIMWMALHIPGLLLMKRSLILFFAFKLRPSVGMRLVSFTWSLKTACMQTIKAKQSLYYTHAQVSSPSKACFFLNWKPGVSTIPKPAFLVDFSGILQLKNSVLGLMGLQGMHISSFGKWVWPVLMRTKMKSSPKALLK